MNHVDAYCFKRLTVWIHAVKCVQGSNESEDEFHLARLEMFAKQFNSFFNFTLCLKVWV